VVTIRAFAYKGQAIDVKQVGRELGVHYVLEGSVQKGGNRVRINAQLIEAETGAHLWADRFDGSLEDVFDVQDEVASSVAEGVVKLNNRSEKSSRTDGSHRPECPPRYNLSVGFADQPTPQDLERDRVQLGVWRLP
jgi:adenylate cyclase